MFAGAEDTVGKKPACARSRALSNLTCCIGLRSYLVDQIRKKKKKKDIVVPIGRFLLPTLEDLGHAGNREYEELFPHRIYRRMVW